MTPNEFASAVKALQLKGAIPAGHGWKTALASLLGVTRPTINLYEKRGTQRQTDFALAAILAGVKPCGEKS